MDQMGDLFAAHHAGTEEVTPEQAAARHLQEIYRDKRGTFRFRENKMVTTLQEHGPDAIQKLGVLNWPKGWELDQFKQLLNDRDPIIKWLMEYGPADMNRLAVQDFPQESRERFAMLIGYSVGGAGELSYFSDAMYNRAWAACEKIKDAE